MIHLADTPEEYLKVLPDDWRRASLISLRNQILSHRDVSESMKYGMLAYSMGKAEAFIALNAQKNYVSLYVGHIDKIPGAEKLLEGYNRGKGCLRLTKTVSPEAENIREFLRRAIQFHRDGGDMSC